MNELLILTIYPYRWRIQSSATSRSDFRLSRYIHPWFIYDRNKTQNTYINEFQQSNSVGDPLDTSYELYKICILYKYVYIITNILRIIYKHENKWNICNTHYIIRNKIWNDYIHLWLVVTEDEDRLLSVNLQNKRGLKWEDYIQN